MDSQEQTLIHYGVLGMKWGVRKQRPKSSKKRRSKSAGASSKSKTSATSNNKSKIKASKSRKKVKDMTNAELEAAINRAKLEQQYTSLNNNVYAQTGKEIVTNIAKVSAINVGAQLLIYGLGTAVNKVAGQNIVNPKKGQKK